MMKSRNLQLLAIGLIILSACSQPSKEQPVETQFFGASMTTDGSVQIANIAKLMNESDTVNLKLSGKIMKTCAKKGCWMTVDKGNGETVRVTFKDYGFFVPKQGVEGKTAVFEGAAIRRVIPVEELRHYAVDAGQSAEEIAAITEPKEEYTFVANGVAIQ